MTTFVLVHGAWRGGWIWKRVRPLLARGGHEVFTPTLTGVGDRSHLNAPSIDLETHITDVMNLLRWEELDDVVLCGHSYAGCVVTGVADRMPERVRALFIRRVRARQRSVAARYARPSSARPRSSARTQGDVEVAADSGGVLQRGRGGPRLGRRAGHCAVAARSGSARVHRRIGSVRQRELRATDSRASPFRSSTTGPRLRVDTHMVACGHDVMLARPRRGRAIADAANRAASAGVEHGLTRRV